MAACNLYRKYASRFPNRVVYSDWQTTIWFYTCRQTSIWFYSETNSHMVSVQKDKEQYEFLPIDELHCCIYVDGYYYLVCMDQL